MSEPVEVKLAEAPKKATLQELISEYGRLVQQAGEKQYHILCLQDDIALINNRLKAINQEAAVLKSEEAAQAASEEPKS